MTKLLLPLLLRFVLVTVPLTLWWMNGGRDAYFRFFIDLARPILIALDVIAFNPSMVHDRFLSVVPFVGLMLATPRLSLRRRVLGLLGGYGVIFLSQIALTWWGHVVFVRSERGQESMADFFPVMMLCDALPFVLWAIIANAFIAELLSTVMGPGPADDP